MAADVKAILDEKDKDKKKALVEEFKSKHAANLDKLIDPNHPDLGPTKQSDRRGLGSAQRRPRRLVQAVCRGPGHDQRSRSHHGMSGFAVFHLQGHQRTVRGRKIYATERSSTGRQTLKTAASSSSWAPIFLRRITVPPTGQSGSPAIWSAVTRKSPWQIRGLASWHPKHGNGCRSSREPMLRSRRE